MKPEHRKWTVLRFFASYLMTTSSLSSYNVGATLISLGLVRPPIPHFPISAGPKD
jgi:cytosine/uracil/thiamine/allantoin permease